MAAYGYRGSVGSEGYSRGGLMKNETSAVRK